MGYVERIMGDREHAVYQTHQHLILLLERIASWLFALLVFLGIGLAIFFLEDDKQRFVIGLIALGSVVLPVYLIVAPWLRGERGEAFLKRIWRPILAGIMILVVALVIMFRPETRPIGWVAVALSLIPLAEVTRIFLDWLNERYIITNRRVMVVRGTVNKEVSDSALEKVNDVKMRQSIVGRLLNYGTVEIITGSDIGVNMFHRIANPVRLKREMLNAKENLHEPEAEEDWGPAKGPVSPPSEEPALDKPEPEQTDVELAPESRSIPAMIEELAELRQKGIISKEEFQAKKKELLDRL